MLGRYARWLHLQWPAGTVETLPEVREDGSTNVPGLFVAGDLTGIPLLKLASDSGARVVGRLASDPAFTRGREKAAGDPVRDLVILGAGIAGMAAAIEAKKAGLDAIVIEASEPFSTLINFPRRKPIFTYPSGMTPAGSLQFTRRSDIKEGLVEEMRETAARHGIEPIHGRAERVIRRSGRLEVALDDGTSLAARRVLVAIGRSGDHRTLKVPGESLDKVFNRLHDPADHANRDVLVVGGGDSAAETAIAIARAGGRVTLSHRSAELTRPKPENLASLRALSAPGGPLRIEAETTVEEIRPSEAILKGRDGARRTLPNDVVFVMIGREAPLDFFRRSGVRLRREWRPGTWAAFAAVLLACVFLYNWKAGGRLNQLFHDREWFPYNVPAILASFGEPDTLAGTLRLSLGSPGFYYSLAYCACVAGFG